MSIDGGLRPLFRKYIHQFDWTSIESGTTGGGIPDSNFCHHGTEGWVEFKLTTGWTVPLRPEQVGWLARRARHGGRVWVAVRQKAPAGPRRAAVDALWLVPGALAPQAKAHGLRGPLMAAHALCWQGQMGGYTGPSAWNWQAIADALLA